jgi:hypothetical protein
MCCKAEEHIRYIVAGCTALAPSEYTNRHNKVAGYLHWTICKHMGLQVTEKYYEHIPEKVINDHGTTIMCDIRVITDQAILANRPDRVLHHKNEKTCLLINITIPDDQKLTQKKLKNLEIKVSRMWKVKTKIVPIIF